jgi:hypothetical protein
VLSGFVSVQWQVLYVVPETDSQGDDTNGSQRSQDSQFRVPESTTGLGRAAALRDVPTALAYAGITGSKQFSGVCNSRSDAALQCKRCAAYYIQSPLLSAVLAPLMKAYCKVQLCKQVCR